ERAPPDHHRMRRGPGLPESIQGEHTYGVNTGFGRFVSARIPDELTEELQVRLLRSHACGVGEPYPDEVVRAAVLLRANTLAKGYSGARIGTVELLLACLNRGVLPVVPSRGSVGASAHLAPLAHLALPLIGEGEAWFEGERLVGGDALRRAGLEPITLASKEGLSLVNGTQFMSAMAALGVVRARRLARAADLACALSLEALQGSRSSFQAGVPKTRAPRVRALARDPSRLALELPGGDPQDAAARRSARRGGEHLEAPRGVGDHRVAPLVRQGAGRVLAALRAAGARGMPRSARLRGGDRERRAERRDRQPARAA